MSVWADFLDGVVARDPRANPPGFISIMRLPGIDGWEPGRVWVSWTPDESFLLPGGGAVFGGYLAAVADNVMALLMFTVLLDDENFTTSNLDLRFIRPVTPGPVEVEATIVNRGKRLAHCELTIKRADGKLAAMADATQVIV
ncbi:MAG: PaaI family thioesterase [Candidatus Dormibacteria bacterium]